jgi:hypothetical protein
VRELTWAKIAAASMFNISTLREQAAHHEVLRWRLTITHLSVSTVISVRVFIVGQGQYRNAVASGLLCM